MLVHSATSQCDLDLACSDITCDAEQKLFDHCTAKFANNTQCSVPVFDVIHERPLCSEHGRKAVSDATSSAFARRSLL